MASNEQSVARPPLSSFDLSDVRRPDDGVLYLYQSAVDGFWYVDSDADMALQEATNYPVGELVAHEAMGEWEDGERGNVIAVYVGATEPGHEECPKCGKETATVSVNGRWFACDDCGAYEVPR